MPVAMEPVRPRRSIVVSERGGDGRRGEVEGWCEQYLLRESMCIKVVVDSEVRKEHPGKPRLELEFGGVSLQSLRFN